MTTGSNGLPPALRRWAAEQLGLDEDASAEQAQRAFLARLRESEFSPPPAWASALGLWRQGLPDRWDAHAAARRIWEGLLRDEVEVFASEFFSLDVGERQRRFRELRASCEPFSPQLSARLAALEKGLEIDAAAVPREGSPVGDLARHVMRLFVLRPAERAATRRALIVESQGATDRWHEAACGLGFRYAPFAALDSALVDYWKEANQREGRRDEFHRRLRSRRQPVVRSNRGSRDGSERLVFVAAIIIFGIFRLIAMFDGSRHSPPQFKLPPPSPPARDLFPDRPNDRQIQEILKRVEELKAKAAEKKP